MRDTLLSGTRTNRRAWIVGVMLTMAMMAALCALGTAGARAAFGISAFDGAVNANAAGDAYTQAGGHPFDISTDITFNTTMDPNLGLPFGDGDPKTVRVDLPPGLVGSPAAVPRCAITDFLNADFAENKCQADTQVGVAVVDVPGFAQWVPVYSIEPGRDDVPAAFGFTVAGVPVTLEATVRSGSDYGVTVTAPNINQGVALNGTKLTLWGVPAAAEHDSLRCKIIGQEDNATGPYGCWESASDPRQKPQSVKLPPAAFLALPTICTAPGVGLETTLTADSWANPGVFDSKSFFSHLPPGYPLDPADWGPQQGPTGCDALPFAPTAKVQPTSRSAAVPTGLDVDLDVPQDGFLSPKGLSTAHVKKVTVALPAGMSISPGAANGLQACSDAQAGFGDDDDPACPDASKVGTVTIRTPVLDQPLEGSVYIGRQQSMDPGSGEMFRLVLFAKGPGVALKLRGAVRPDEQTGQLTTTFDNNPQLPFSSLHLELKGGSRAPLLNPPSCGEKTTVTEFSSWSGQTATSKSSFSVECTPGLGGFSPTLMAGAASPVAGAFSPFTMGITKPDGNADINGLSMVLPTGLLAQLKGNLGTQVGSVEAFAGTGSSPYVLPGQVYLEGPYGDAPFSLKVVVPAKAGPFDLGEVIVRQKIYVDPITAQVTVVSDPVPTIVKGVPVRLQRLDVSVDKPGFMINPTSCATKAIGGTLGAVGGQSVPIDVRFQVGDCASLDLKPSLALSLSGKGQTTDGKHPAVTADLIQKPGQSNLKKVRVALPLSLALDPDNANGLCEFADGSKTTPTCPKASIVGTATAVTPILDEPLSGPVYFVKNIRKDPKSGREIRTLPKLVIPLTGQNGVKLTLTGTSDVENDKLVTTFDNIPDAPVSSFKLSIIGGKGGILTVSGADICKATQIADQQVDGQNNKVADADIYIQTPSCPLKVISKKVTARGVTLKVGGVGAGKVTVTGRGIRKATKTVAKSTVATVTAKRSKGKPGKVTVSFDPAGPAKVRKTTK